MENQTREKPFTSWKEIAAYLGCDERTCLRWEKDRGLPVHRAGGGPSKSLVFAYRSELDEWLGKRKGEETVKLPPGSSAARAHSRRALPFILASSGLLIVAFLALYFFIIKPPETELSQPYDFRIERSVLIITNQEGTELSRFDTRMEDLMNEAGYRLHFGHKTISNDNQPRQPWLKFDDIDEDGHTETLIIIRPGDDSGSSILVCLDAKGEILWTYAPGREMVFGSKRISPDYALDGFDILKTSGTGKRVMALARHKPEFPSIVAVLDPRGKTLGEYWNSGRIADYALADLDYDGREDLVIVGTNNEYAKGFLAVLDPDHIWGSSPQTGEYRSADLKPGSEMCYLLFPRTVIDQIEFGQREAMDLVDVLKNNLLQTISQMGRIIYEIKPNMEVYEVILTDSFREKYRKFQEEGRLPPGPLDENALRESLSRSIVYYDGRRWTTTVSLNKVNRHLFEPRNLKSEANPRSE